MSAVAHHLPLVAYLDWSEFSDFDDSQKEQAVKILREAQGHLERLTLRQSIAEAAQSQDIKDVSVWTAFWLLWGQIRDGNPESERVLMHVLDEWESDQGWTARASRELITTAIEAYHQERIERAASMFRAWGVNFKAMLPGGDRYAELGQQVAEGTLSLLDAALSAEHTQAGTD